MKERVLLFIFLFSGFQFVAQNRLEDSVKIPEVKIHGETVEGGKQQLGSELLFNPTYQDLGELLQKESHLFVKTYGSGSLATPSMRGSGSSHTRIYWNGILLNAPSNGTYDLSLIPNLFVDQVEINYGLQSLAQGSGGLGGSLLLKNKPQFEKQQQLKFSRSQGSFGRQTTSLRWQMGNEKWQSISRLFLRKADNDFKFKDKTVEGFPTKRVKNASLLQKGAMQSIHYRLGDNQMLETHLWWSFSDRNLPPLITMGDNRERQEDQSLKAVAKYSYYGENWKFNYRFSATKDRLTYENQRAKILESNKVNGIFNQANLEVSWSKKLQTKTQFQFNRQQANSRQLIGKPERKTISAYQRITFLPLKKIKLHADFRTEQILGEKDLYMPALSIHFFPDLKKTWMIYLKAGKNQKFPSLNDLYTRPFGNPNLKAEKSKTFESGAGWRKTWKQIEFSGQLNLFASRIKNYIQWQPTAFGFWQAVNLQEVQSRGLEWRMELKQSQGKLKKQLSLNYTFTQSLNQKKSHTFDDSKGKQLIYIPENQFNLRLKLGFKEFDLNYQYHFVGHRYTTSDNSRFIDAYSTSDLTISRHIMLKNHQFDLSFSVLNLFDADYQMMEWRPVPGRNFNFRLTYTIGQ